MTTLLFFDTETTGLPKRDIPLTAASQPHICQIAAVMTDEDGQEKNSIDMLIKPEGWEITEETTAIHGITQAEAEKFGMGIKGVIGIMRRWIDMADIVIGHNIQFDQWMLKREAAGCGYPDDYFPYKEIFCTMNQTRDLMKLPPTEKMMNAGIKQFKSAKLSEVYKHLIGEELMGAHDAMTDVRGCRRVYFKMKSLREDAA